MNKNELIRAIANKARITLKDADAYFDAVIDCISDALNANEKIQISGFGSYELKCKGARDGINPKTGEKIKVDATKIPAFKFSKAYKDSFNK
ncbi:MAG: HU family DNA-binding protein [Clostridia bacterium]|jgi:nucleoid DNA-binding protein|nr:HU family DNA-binding protein [Clostridia bacterium]